MKPIDDPFVLSSSRGERLEAVDLLEKCWFFDNLLDRRKSMLRCYSDPCPSSNFSQEMLVWNSCQSCVETSSSIRKLTGDGNGLVSPNLVRTPSLAASTGRKEGIRTKESNSRTMESAQPSLCHRLLQTPSLPPCIGREKVSADEESDPRMRKLSRQASLNPLYNLPPGRTSKGMKQCSSMPTHRPHRLKMESMNMDGSKEMSRRYLNQRKMGKSPSDLEFEEVQGFKDLGFTFDKEDLNPSVVNILPGLQEKDCVDSDDDKVRRPYLSEAWLEQCSAPPIPNWVVKKSAEDMKTQIRYWARAVASNVRQEC